jgi:RNA polymerase sigma-70 factor (ECF subfamily)
VTPRPQPQDPASRAFRRFREDGEPAALTEVFDLVGPGLFALAAHLARDVADAEDLVQETFLASIRGVRRFDPSRAVTPWLVGILVKEAGRAKRRRRRAQEAADVTAHEPAAPTPGPGSELASGEVQRTVAAALATLPAAYRSVLEPVLQDGARPGDVAARLGRAPGTVRAQLHRGLELLRRALPRGLAPAAVATTFLHGGSSAHAGNAGALAHTLGDGLAAVRMRIAAHAAAEGQALAVGAGAATITLPLLGTIVMGSTSLVAGALAAAAVLGFLLLRDPSPAAPLPVTNPVVPEEVAVTPLAPAPTTPSLSPARTSVMEEAAPPSTLTEPAAAAPEVPVARRILVRGEVRGTRPTVEGLELFVRLGVPSKVAAKTRIPGDGPFELDVTDALGGSPPNDHLTLLLRGPGHVESVAIPRPIEAREGEHVLWADLDARPIQRTLRGRLVDEDGAPLGLGSLVEFVAEGEVRRALGVFPSVHADRNGRFELVLATAAPGRFVAAAQGLRAVHRDVSEDEIGELDLGDVVLTRGASIRGTARAHGVPVPRGSAVVARAEASEATFNERALGFQARAGIVHHELVTGEVAADGTFVLDGLEPGFVYDLVVVPRRVGGIGVTHVSSATSDLRVTAPASDVMIDSGLVAVLLEVVDEAGPVNPARVVAAGAESTPRVGATPAFGAQGVARTDRRGRAGVLLAPDRPTKLWIDAPAHEGVEVVIDPAALASSEDGLRGPMRVELVRLGGPGTIVWHLTDEQGAAISGTQAICSLFGSSSTSVGPVPVEGGVARFTEVPVGTWSAAVVLTVPKATPLEELPYWVLTGIRETVVVAPDGIVELRTQLPTGGRIELSLEGYDPSLPPLAVELFEETGNVVRPLLVTRSESGHTTARSLAGPGPYYLDRALPAAMYTVRVMGTGYTTVELEAKVEAGRTTRVTASLERAR